MDAVAITSSSDPRPCSLSGGLLPLRPGGGRRITSIEVEKGALTSLAALRWPGWIGSKVTMIPDVGARAIGPALHLSAHARPLPDLPAARPLSIFVEVSSGSPIGRGRAASLSASRSRSRLRIRIRCRREPRPMRDAQRRLSTRLVNRSARRQVVGDAVASVCR